jgi:tetratricopeptide (TPR) repeat protein
MWRRHHDSAKQHFLMALEINENSHPLSSSSPRPDLLRDAISSIHESLGEIALNQGRLEEAEAEYKKAADTSPMHIPPDGLMSMRTLQGRVALKRRDWSAASEHFRSAFRISLDNQREAHGAIHLFNLGAAEMGKRNWAAAKEFYEDALDVCNAHPDKPTEANIRYQLALVSGELGNDPAARGYWSDALTLYDALQMPHRKADCYRFLAKQAQKDTNWVQAEAYCSKAIEIVETEGVDKDHAGGAYFALAEVLARQGKRDAAKKQYETAFRFLNPGAERATTAFQLGLLANAAKRYTQAKVYLTESLTWAEENPAHIAPHDKAGMLYELGVAFLQDRPYDLHVAERRYWQALAIYIDGADYQRQKVVETRLKDVVSLFSLACKQACDAFDALATNEEKASFARNRGASTS